MTVASLLKAALANNGGVAALVGARIYPVYLPQTPTLAAISYQRISNTGQNGTSDRKESRWQVNCWAATHLAGHALAAAVKTALEEYHDSDQTPGIDWARVVNELDDYDPDVAIYRVIVDVILHTTGD